MNSLLSRTSNPGKIPGVALSGDRHPRGDNEKEYTDD
jgi:hypothetical protein